MKVEFEAALHILFVLVLPGSHAMFAGHEHIERQTKPIARREPQHFSQETARRLQLDHITVDPKVESVLLEKADISESITSINSNHGDTESSTSHNEQPAFRNVNISDYNTSAYCGEDYVLGTVNGTDCGPDHYIIIDPDACIDAAGRVGARTTSNSFYIAADKYYNRPQGCFAAHCSQADPTGVCFFYNGVGDRVTVPADNETEFFGRPVCSRQRWLNGAAVDGTPHPDSNPSGCAAGYSGILDNQLCQQMLACRTLCRGNPFEIDTYNQTLHDQFPQGCFIHVFDGCVYFNPPDANSSLPSQPVGVPVCEVSNRSAIHFPEYGSIYS